MSYKKISEGNNIIKRSDNFLSSDPNRIQPPFFKKEELDSDNKRVNIVLSLPMSYTGCPNCGKDELLSCNCYPINYYCDKCNWRHISHIHDTHPSVDINNGSLLEKHIRK